MKSRSYAKLYLDAIDHEKIVVLLPDDKVRWTWITAIVRGKLRTPQGQWGSLEHMRLSLGRPASHLESLVKARLLDQRPDGSVELHDWDDWQSRAPEDVTASERMRRHRANKSATDRNVTRNVTVEPVTPLRATQRTDGDGDGDGDGDKPPSPAPRGGLTDSDFVPLFDAYPRREGKPSALRAIRKAVPSVAKARSVGPPEAVAWLLDRVKLYASCRAGQDPQFTPLPATWFNDARYDGDERNWKSGNGPRNGFGGAGIQNRARVAAPAGSEWDAEPGSEAPLDGRAGEKPSPASPPGAGSDRSGAAGEAQRPVPR